VPRAADSPRAWLTVAAAFIGGFVVFGAIYSFGVFVEPIANDLIGSDGRWHTVLAGDMCYERPLAERLIAWLQTLAARGTQVLLGDPGRNYFPQGGVKPIATDGKPAVQKNALRIAAEEQSATVVVTPNEWAARVDPSGQFVLTGVPSGKYSVVAWHKSAGTFRKAIEVTAGQNSEMNFFVPLPELSDGEATTHTGH